jgi:hypothetical protein
MPECCFGYDGQEYCKVVFFVILSAAKNLRGGW